MTSQISKMIANLRPPGNIQAINDLIALIEECTETLEKADHYMKEIQRGEETTLQKMMEAQIEGKPMYANIGAAKTALKMQTIQALIEGYSLVTQLREMVTGQSIGYTVVVGGGTTVAKAELNLEELLSSANLDFGRNGIGLSIRSTEKQINRMLSRIDKGEDLTSKYKRAVFSKMQTMEMDETDKQVWKDLTAVAERTRGGYGINYGTAIESFMQYYRNKDSYIASGITSESKRGIYYDLLEKGRNNLPYYYGGDVEYGSGYSEQIKGMTGFTSKSRFDVATLSNVLTPLQSIKQTLYTFRDSGGSGILEEQLQQQFTANDGQGDRPCQDAVRNEVQSMLTEMFGKPS